MQLIIPAEAAHDTIYQLGEVRTLSAHRAQAAERGPVSSHAAWLLRAGSSRPRGQCARG